MYRYICTPACMPCKYMVEFKIVLIYCLMNGIVIVIVEYDLDIECTTSISICFQCLPNNNVI